MSGFDATISGQERSGISAFWQGSIVGARGKRLGADCWSAQRHPLNSRPPNEEPVTQGSRGSPRERRTPGVDSALRSAPHVGDRSLLCLRRSPQMQSASNSATGNVATSQIPIKLIFIALVYGVWHVSGWAGRSNRQRPRNHGFIGGPT